MIERNRKSSTGEMAWIVIWYHRKKVALGLLIIATIVSAYKAYTWKSYGESMEAYAMDQIETIQDKDDKIYGLSQVIASQDTEKLYLATKIGNLEQENEAIMERRFSRKAERYVVDTYELTAYCSCEICTGEYADGITYSGTEATEGRTIAVDPKLIPIGSVVYIEGLGIRIAEDIGGAIKDKHIDVYFNSHEDALKFGRQTAKIVIIEEGVE